MTRVTLLLLLVTVSFVSFRSTPTTTLFASASSLEQQQQQQQQQEFGDEDNDDDEDRVELVRLVDLSIEQLEEICTSRGFEIIQDNSDVELTHEYYVEAAQECLDVETEMEKLLKERPGIVGELEKERDAMLAEKDRLEAELAAKLKEQELLRETESNTAFVDNETAHDNTDDVTTTTTATESDKDTVTTVPDTSSTTTTTTTTPIKKKKNIQPDPNLLSANSNATSINSNNSNNDPLGFLTLVKDTVEEFRMQIQKDVHMVTEFVLPQSIRGPLKNQVVLPLLRIAKTTSHGALEMMKRYIVLMADSMTKKLRQT